jgi:D-alanyl-D-alanine carboxypeptidase
MGFKRAPTRVATKKPQAITIASNQTSFVLKAPRAIVQSPFPKQRPSSIVARAQADEVLVIEQALLSAISKQPQPQAVQDEPELTIVASGDANIIQASYAPEIKPQRRTELLIVSRDTGPRKWSVQLGALSSRYKAEKLLLRTALADLRALDGALRKIEPTKVQGQTRYRARFVGLSQADANKACARLRARSVECTPVSPGG